MRPWDGWASHVCPDGRTLKPPVFGALFCGRCNDVTDWQAGRGWPCDACGDSGWLRVAEQTFPC